MIHILGLRIFPKSFGFFLGCSQQDLLEIVCERSLLRKATEICSRISLKNCLWIFPIHIIVSYSSRNYEVTPGVCPRPIPQDICLANLSLKTRVVVFATKNNISSNLTKISRPKAKIFWGISPKTPHLFWRYFVKVRYQTICEGQLSTKQASNGNIFQTNSKRNLYQRVFGKTCLPKKTKEKSRRTKNLKRKLSPKNLLKQFLYQKLSGKILPRKLWRDIPCQINIWRTISTKTSVSRDISLPKELKKNLYAKKTSEEKSLPKRMKKHLHQKIREKT